MPPKKVLVIEDEVFISDLYKYQLTKSGFDVTVAGDGLTGLKTLQNNLFDILLLDIMLPGMNGLEVLRDWRTKNPDSKMVILLLTNLGQDAVIKEGFTLGAQGYLIKASYTPEQVVTEINNALAGKQQEATTNPASNILPTLEPSTSTATTAPDPLAPAPVAPPTPVV